MTDERDLKEEADFADAEYLAFNSGTAINKRMFDRYRDPVHAWDWRQSAAILMGDLNGKRLLDYGCGQGEESAYFALLGAEVTAIDISPEGVRIANERAAANQIADRCVAYVMNATPTTFPSESFDMIHGMGILHHLELDAALAEVHRLLVPGGTAIFLEPVGNNRVIEWCKESMHKWLEKPFRLRPLTSGERNLRFADLRASAKAFSELELHPYHLLSRARKLIAPRRWHTGLLKLDHAILSVVPPLAHFCGAVVIRLRK